MFSPDTRILVVDDMMTMRKLVRKALTELGFSNIMEAPDGEQAWAKINDTVAINSPFQLIICDWNMPNMKGIDLLKKVRASSAMKAVPFILLTAESEKDQVVEAMAAGVSEYLLKPFTKDTLGEKLRLVSERPNKAA